MTAAIYMPDCDRLTSTRANGRPIAYFAGRLQFDLRLPPGRMLCVWCALTLALKGRQCPLPAAGRLIR